MYREKLDLEPMGCFFHSSHRDLPLELHGRPAEEATDRASLSLMVGITGDVGSGRRLCPRERNVVKIYKEGF
jgi:hypothetical protein